LWTKNGHGDWLAIVLILRATLGERKSYSCTESKGKSGLPQASLRNSREKFRESESLKVFVLRINMAHFGLGACFLIAGVLVYVLARPASSTYFLIGYPELHSVLPNLTHLLRPIASTAPEFFHPLALSLLSMAVLTNTRSRVVVCFSWLTIDAFFECCQKYGEELAQYIPLWFEQVPVLKKLDDFIRLGTFDSSDLIAILCGTLTALIINVLTSSKEGGNHEQDHRKP